MTAGPSRARWPIRAATTLQEVYRHMHLPVRHSLPAMAVAAWGLAFSATLLLAAPATAQIYRCGTTYSQKPCPGGTEVDTSPPVSVHGQPGRATVLYLCRGYDGGLFWTREHCRQRRALIEHTEMVPAHLGFEQQVELAKAQRDRSQAAAAPLPAAVPQVGSALRDEPGQCVGLEERIRQLDQMARTGGTASYMDWVANERKLVRDRQFRLRC